MEPDDDEILLDAQLAALEDDQDDAAVDEPTPEVPTREIEPGEDGAELEERQRLELPELDVTDDGTDPLAAYAVEDDAEVA